MPAGPRLDIRDSARCRAPRHGRSSKLWALSFLAVRNFERISARWLQVDSRLDRTANLATADADVPQHQIVHRRERGEIAHVPAVAEVARPSDQHPADRA